jgi:hypothetical protein
MHPAFVPVEGVVRPEVKMAKKALTKREKTEARIAASMKAIQMATEETTLTEARMAASMKAIQMAEATSKLKDKSGDRAGSLKRKSTSSPQSAATTSQASTTSSAASKHRKLSPAPTVAANAYKDINSETEDEESSNDRKQASSNRQTQPVPPASSDVATASFSVMRDQSERARELRAALVDSEERRQRAEQQVRNISRTRIADTFLEGQVRTWSKETLWKQCKFITNDPTMNKVIRKAAKHFKVPELEKEHWMSTYAHIVRDGLNQKRNAVAQDLRQTVKSKYGMNDYIGYDYY